MPTFDAPDPRMHYLVEDLTDTWTEPEKILLLHGNAESSLAWYAWMPLLARRFRVVRPDMRGYGASTPMPRDFPWSSSATTPPIRNWGSRTWAPIWPGMTLTIIRATLRTVTAILMVAISSRADWPRP